MWSRQALVVQFCNVLAVFLFHLVILEFWLKPSSELSGNWMCFRRRVERRGRVAPIELSRQCLAKKQSSPRDTDQQLTASFIVFSTCSCARAGVCVCVCVCVCVDERTSIIFNEMPYSGSKVIAFGRTDRRTERFNLLKPNDIYIYMSYRSANLQTLHFKYLFNKYTY